MVQQRGALGVGAAQDNRGEVGLVIRTFLEQQRAHLRTSPSIENTAGGGVGPPNSGKSLWQPEQQTFDVIGFLHHRARVTPCDDRARRLQLAV